MNRGMILRMGSAAAWLAGAGSALAIAGCGGDGDQTQPKTPGTEAARASPSPEGEAAPTRKADAGDVAVVRAWADTLRRGDVRGAARYFALPSTVSNGTGPIRLETRAEARFFNRTLPCGAKLIKADPASSGFIIVTFRLTERPGKGSCGAGAGGTARAAFHIRRRHITDWLRVPDASADAEPDAQA